MNYKTFERIMDKERIEMGTKDFKEYLSQYDFGSGKWDDLELLDSDYVLEKLFHLLKLSMNLNRYGEMRDLLESLIIDVAKQEIINAEWIKPRMDEIKLISYYE
jgi:hypothetical protein